MIKCKIGLLRRSRSFKVIELCDQSKALCDVLSVINRNWHTISYHFGVIAAHCSNFGHFALLSPTLGGLGATYDVHLTLSGKRVVDNPLVLIKHFGRCYGWVATSENRLEISDFAPTRSLWPNISGRRGRTPPIILHRYLGQWMPYNFAADSFQTKKLCSRHCSSEVRF